MNIIENGKFIMEIHPESGIENIDIAREYYASTMVFQDSEYQELLKEVDNVREVLFAFYKQQFNEKYMPSYYKVNNIDLNLKEALS